jgi:predicted Zn finger-like uncharacterized protein
MLTPNIIHHAMLRLQAAVLHNRIVRIADGVSCPACGTVIRITDPEDTNDGWRILCGSCHRDILVVEELRP